MGMYESFAEVYDTFMDNVPYEEWTGWLIEQLREDGIRDGIVLDLGCGTGSATELLAEAGYDMIGIDNSIEMLEIAQDKRVESGHSILYLEQDMREFELYGTVRAVVSICDSVNYITSEEDLLEVFRLVNNYLDPNGLFIFDMNTMYKYTNLLGDRTIAESREECSFIWENSWYPDDRINEYDLTLFLQDEDGRYTRFDETHYQKAYEVETVKELLTQAGLKVEAVYDAYTRDAVRPDSERVCFVARELNKVKNQG